MSSSFGTQSSPSLPSTNSYIIEAQNVQEVARLVFEDRIFTRFLGDLFPATINLSTVHTVLDIGCGPGGWVLDVAQAHPSIHAIGIDISPQMIKHAKLYAFAENVKNAEFLEMNALQPLVFPEATFDVINARFLYTFVSREQWVSLFRAWKRLLKPGGILRLTELEGGFSNSPAVEEFNHLYFQSLYETGHGFSPRGRSTGIPAMLRRFLHEAGFQSLHHQAYGLDCSYGTEASQEWFEEVLQLFHAMIPFLVKAGGATQQEMETLCQEVADEVRSELFCAITYLLSTWGVKAV